MSNQKKLQKKYTKPKLKKKMIGLSLGVWGCGGGSGSY